MNTDRTQTLSVELDRSEIQMLLEITVAESERIHSDAVFHTLEYKLRAALKGGER